MKELFEAIFQNHCINNIFVFLIEYAATKGLDLLLRRSNGTDAHELLATQLLECLQAAHLKTCEKFNWEYDDAAILKTFQQKQCLWDSISTENQLICVLSQAVGADETAIVTEAVVTFWLQTLEQEIACRQELFNYSHEKKAAVVSIDKKMSIRTDSNSYEAAFFEPLFLEDALNEERKATLKEVYIPPKYRVDTLQGEKRVDIFEMLVAFFNNRPNFTIQQAQDFPVINKRIFAIMLMGKPGIGKSSFVSFLSVNLRDSVHQRPCYIIRLRNMLEDQINSSDPMSGILSYMRATEQMLDNSILVLDGLDEICAIYKKLNFHAYLKRLLQNLSIIPGLQLVLTSRTGYFRIDDAIKKYCLVVNIDNWDNQDLDTWSYAYSDIHHKLSAVVESNRKHLQDTQYSDKKAIFAVPILFYMANARGEYLLNHSSICSVYDAVLTEVAGDRHYDSVAYLPAEELITPALARQICREIAFAMFRNGRFAVYEQSIPVDPYLSPEEVESAISEAIRICNASPCHLDEKSKQKIKNFYALTFYYNRENTKQNAVEFAHKTIAEYFAAEKILEILEAGADVITEMELCAILAECFGYEPITNDILIFINEKLKIIGETLDIKKIKSICEDFILAGAISGALFTVPTKHKSKLHYLDRAVIMLKSALVLFEYLNCDPTKRFPEGSIALNNIITTISRAEPINAQHRSQIPISLNGFILEDGDFSGGSFSEAHLSGANLKHANFSDADLIDAHLSGSCITITDFTGADLAGSDLTEIKRCDAADFTQASLHGADLSGSSFYNTSFDGAELQEACLEQCVFGAGCHFDTANLYSANLDYADISQANIEGAVFDDQDDDTPISISHLTLTHEQFEYISSFSNVRLLEPNIVDIDNE